MNDWQNPTFSARSSAATASDSAETVIYRPQRNTNNNINLDKTFTKSPNAAEFRVPKLLATSNDRNSLAKLVSPNCTKLGERDLAVFEAADCSTAAAIDESFQSNADNLQLMEEAERKFAAASAELHVEAPNLSVASNLVSII